MARIYNYMFYGCKALTTMEYDSNCKLTAVGNYTFYGCKAFVDGDDIIPTSVTTIGERAFSGCTNLETITIPGKVTSIGQYGFADCTALASVTSLAVTPPSIKENCFSTDTYNNATLNVSNTPAYGQAVGWKKFLNVNATGAPTAISDVVADAPKIAVNNGNITVEGDRTIMVYSMSGALVGEGHDVPVTPGLYIVKVDGRSYKIQVKH